MVKKITSILLALLILLSAVLVLCMGIGSVSKAIINIIIMIRDSQRYSFYNLLYFHNFYCHNYEDYLITGYGNYFLVNSNVVHGNATVINPYICIILNFLKDIASLLNKFIVAGLLFALSIRLFACGKGKVSKITKNVSACIGALFFLGFACTNLVMGFVRSCVWIRTLISFIIATFELKDIRWFFEIIFGSSKFNVYGIIFYVVALVAFVATIFLIASMFNKKEKLKAKSKAQTVPKVKAEPKKEPKVEEKNEVNPEGVIIVKFK